MKKDIKMKTPWGQFNLFGCHRINLAVISRFGLYCQKNSKILPALLQRSMESTFCASVS